MGAHLCLCTCMNTCSMHVYNKNTDTNLAKQIATSKQYFDPLRLILYWQTGNATN